MNYSRINYLHLNQFLAEILSSTTRTYDLVDKFLAFRNLPSLQYYQPIEPEYYHATLHFKASDGIWQGETCRKLSEEIRLLKLEIGVPLSAICKGLQWD